MPVFETPQVSNDQRALIDKIELSRGRLKFQLEQNAREWHGSLRRDMAARADRGSNSIEGYHASIDDAKAIAVGDATTAASPNISTIYAGYQRAMRYVLQCGADPSFTYAAATIKAIHFMIMDGDQRTSPGQWRTSDIWVQDRDGNAVYQGPSPALVPALIDELIASLDDRTSAPDEEPHTLVRAAMAHLNLVMIHPFRDGNGRASRALQTLVLLRDGVLGREFSSIEEQLGRETQDYYRALSTVGSDSWNPSGDASSWVTFALQAHLRQAQRTEDRFAASEMLWQNLATLVDAQSLHPRMTNALFDAITAGVVRNQSYRRSVEILDPTGITDATAGKDLGKLVAAGLLIKHGSKRGTSYTASVALMDSVGLRPQQLALFN